MAPDRTLPEHLWIIILQKLKVKSLLNMTLTCTTFNNLIGNTTLNEKLKLNVRLPYIQVKDLECSSRNYSSIVIHYYYENSQKSSEYFQTIIKIFELFSQSIRKIKLKRFTISYDKWIKLIETLNHVDTLELFMFTVLNTNDLKDTFKCTMTIDSLVINCPQYENTWHGMDLFDKVGVKNVDIIAGNSTYHKKFLLNHKELKGLKAKIKMFKNDNLSNVTFSLKYLDLYRATWYNRQNALNFIRTQTDLRRVYLRLGVDQYDILLLKHIINNNLNLDELLLELKRGCDKLLKNDIHHIGVNHNVTRFYFKTPENPSLSAKVLKLFPNNKATNDHHFFHDRERNLNSRRVFRQDDFNDRERNLNYRRVFRQDDINDRERNLISRRIFHHGIYDFVQPF